MAVDQALSELPEEVRAAIQAPQIKQREVLDALGVHLAKLRDEAVSARKESGIEATWLAAEEAYLGIDDENRSEFMAAKWAKPMTMEGPLTRPSSTDGDGIKATAFVKLTARYVDAGCAKVCEIALPVDGKPFTLKATPVPEMHGAQEDDTPAEQITGQPMPGPDGQPLTVADLAKHAVTEAEAAAEKAATRIYDWMVEYKHAAELRKVIFDGARIGTGVLKGPIPEPRRSIAVRRAKQPTAQDGMAPTPVAQAAQSLISVEIVDEVKPTARWVDTWCIYPAPGCGENIHKGGHIFEVDPMLPGELNELSRSEEFDAEAIKKVIAEGPEKRNVEGQQGPHKPLNKHTFKVWHFHGKIDRDAFMAANQKQGETLQEGVDQVFVVATLVNDTVIRAVQNPLDSGRLPYHVFNWRRRAGHWAGVGIAEQIKTPQVIANAANRRMLTNGGQSSGAQVVMDPNAVEPANRDMRITPDKLWWLRKDAGIDDVRKVFASFVWPNTTPELLTIIKHAEEMAEWHCSVPLITQGQSGNTTPDTFSGQQLQDNNANQLLRDVGFGLNDDVTTPLVDQFYEWLLLDPDVPDDEKGDYKVDTSGALANIEKALQKQTIMALFPLANDPAYKIDKAKLLAMFARGNRLSPEEIQYTDAEWEKVQQNSNQPPLPIQVAQIRAESAEKIAASRDQLAAQKNQNDLDRDTAYTQSLTYRAENDHDARLRELALRERLAMLDYANRTNETLDNIKAQLAQTTMKLQVQRELAGADGKGPQVETPPTEPPGRAPSGMAYQA